MSIRTLFTAACVAAVLVAGVAAMNPRLARASTDHCFPIGTPHSDICFGTRCVHLFNKTAGRLNPVPSEAYPQNYPGFGCNVTEWYEYGPEIPGRRCLQPVCFCKQHYLGGACVPTRFNDCAQHKCVYNQHHM